MNNKSSILVALLGVLIGVLGVLTYTEITERNHRLRSELSDWRKLNLVLKTVDENYVDAVDRFLDKLAGVADPETKRKIIGKEFIDVFAEEAKKLEGIEFLAQGTIYPDILESKGIKVISTEAPEGFDGVSGIVNGKDYIIVLNSSKSNVERRRFTGMHELGHLLYNDRFSADLTPRQKEKLCDSFANEMLLPTDTLKKIFKPGERISTSELMHLQLIYGISIDAIMHKLVDIGILSESKYKSYCINKGKNKALKDFVEETRYRENMTNKFETMVYAAAAKDLITTSKAASLLHSSVGTVRKHLNVI